LVTLELQRSVIIGDICAVLPSWLSDPLWDLFAALFPERPTYDTTRWLPSPTHQ
jgi:hypothetical protein